MSGTTASTLIDARWAAEGITARRAGSEHGDETWCQSRLGVRISVLRACLSSGPSRPGPRHLINEIPITCAQVSIGASTESLRTESCSKEITTARGRIQPSETMDRHPVLVGDQSGSPWLAVPRQRVVLMIFLLTPMLGCGSRVLHEAPEGVEAGRTTAHEVAICAAARQRDVASTTEGVTEALADLEQRWQDARVGGRPSRRERECLRRGVTRALCMGERADLAQVGRLAALPGAVWTEDPTLQETILRCLRASVADVVDARAVEMLMALATAENDPFRIEAATLTARIVVGDARTGAVSDDVRRMAEEHLADLLFTVRDERELDDLLYVMLTRKHHCIACLPALMHIAERGSVNSGWAVQGLAELGEAAAPAVPVLTRLVRERRSALAIDALGKIGPAARDAVPVILNELRREDLEWASPDRDGGCGAEVTWGTAMHALVDIGDTSPEVLDIVRTGMGRREACIRGACLRAWAALAPASQETAEQVLRAACSRDVSDTYQRWLWDERVTDAFTFLSKRGVPVCALIAGTGDDPTSCEQSREALAKIGAAAGCDTERPRP